MEERKLALKSFDKLDTKVEQKNFVFLTCALNCIVVGLHGNVLVTGGL